MPDYDEPIDPAIALNLKRGDVVAFANPVADDTLNGRICLGRIAGLPGDTLKVHNGNLFINGVRLKQVYAIHLFNASFGDSAEAASIIEKYNLQAHTPPVKLRRNYQISFSATDKDALQVAGDSATLAFSKMVKTADQQSLFPNGHANQTGYFYGPVYLPRANDSLLSNHLSATYCQELHRQFESSAPGDTAVFRSAYYFLINDFRMESHDSRQFGALPAHYFRGVVSGLAWKPSSAE